MGTSIIKNWLIILPMIPIAVGGISKGIDIVRYDIFKMSRNEDEIYVKHLAAEHLLDSQTAQIDSVKTKDGGIVIYTYPDKCVVIKRISDDGLVSGIKILPDPEKIENIKEKYSDICRTVYAGDKRENFSLGHHAKDYNYKEGKNGNYIKRIYGDDCILQYKLDKHGNTKEWVWIKYQH